MGSFAADYDMGTTSEMKIKNSLETHFSDSFTKLPKNHVMDYNGNRWIEIKTRRCKKQTYPTTLLPYNKVDFASKADKPTSFVFVFEDGMYSIDFDSVKFKAFEVSLFQRRARIDHTDKMKDYLYIPIEDLQPIQMV